MTIAFATKTPVVHMPFVTIRRRSVPLAPTTPATPVSSRAGGRWGGSAGEVTGGRGGGGRTTGVSLEYRPGILGD